MPSALLHGLPVLLVAVLIALIFRRTGSRRPVYRLSEPWTHAPVLWSATGEVIPAGGPHGDGGPELIVGGGASGRW